MWRTTATETDTVQLKTTSVTDPSSNTIWTTSILDVYSGVLITTTTTWVAQTLWTPSNTTEVKRFNVINNDTSTDSISINWVILWVWEATSFIWDKTAWTTSEIWWVWDVVWPASAVDSNFASFDTTTGKLIKDSWSKASDFAAETTTTIWTLINWADAKTTPVDTDLVPIRDVTGWLLEKVTWANIKATLKTYFDTLYLKPTESLVIAISDETTAITTWTAKATFRMPYAFTLTDVRASLWTASSSWLPTFDINEWGVSILSTKITIDATEKTSTTAVTAPVISDSTLADDAEITIDIDVAWTGAAWAKIYLIGNRT
jgi:hypothetical protein